MPSNPPVPVSRESQPQPASGDPLTCRKCGTVLGHTTADGLVVGGMEIASRISYRCAACGFCRDWRPGKLKIEPITA